MKKGSVRPIFFVSFYVLVFATLGLPFSNGQIVYQPQISNVKVNAYWQTNGANSIDIMAQQTLAVNCTQESNVTSSATITVTGSVGINPTSNTVTLAPKATETIYFIISNVGEYQQVNNVQINVTSYETFTGTETSSSTVTCNLLANLGPSTTLNIHVQDSSNKPVVGLRLQIQYPSSTAEINTTEFTDTNGDIKNMNLATPNGGGYTGQVAIQTEETTKYGASNMTTYVNSGQNDVTVSVSTKGTPTPTQTPVSSGTEGQLIIEVIALVGFLAFLSVIAFVYVRKNYRPKEPKVTSLLLACVLN